MGGLASSLTTGDTLDYFSSLGENGTYRLHTYIYGKSRRFAFIRFKSIDSARQVLTHIDILVKGKIVECKLASANRRPGYTAISRCSEKCLTTTCRLTLMKKS